MKTRIVLVTASNRALLKIAAEKFADEQGYRFTSEPPYFCDLRQAWVHELEKPIDLHYADLILDWWAQAELWESQPGKNMFDNEPAFVTQAKETKLKYKKITI